MVNGMVRQRMADPQVQAGYRQYLAQMRAAGRPPMDYPTYTYNWIYTAGFSAQGIAHARATEAGIARAEQGKVQELRAAEAQRRQSAAGAARPPFRQPAGGRPRPAGPEHHLASNGAALALPHTWQANTQHSYQGQTYRVDASGNSATVHHVLGSDGWWYPLQARR